MLTSAEARRRRFARIRHLIPPHAAILDVGGEAVLRASAYRLLPIGPYDRALSWAIAWDRATRVRNVTRRELRAWFPTSTLLVERVGGLAKSFTVHHRDQGP